MQIKWSKDAKAQVRNIVISTKKYSPKAARGLWDTIHKDVRNLKLFPMMGKIEPKTNNKNIRYIISNNYRILYYIKGGLINIYNVTHSSDPYYNLHIDNNTPNK